MVQSNTLDKSIDDTCTCLIVIGLDFFKLIEHFFAILCDDFHLIGGMVVYFNYSFFTIKHGAIIFFSIIRPRKRRRSKRTFGSLSTGDDVVAHLNRLVLLIY